MIVLQHKRKEKYKCGVGWPVARSRVWHQNAMRKAATDAQTQRRGVLATTVNNCKIRIYSEFHYLPKRRQATARLKLIRNALIGKDFSAEAIQRSWLAYIVCRAENLAVTSSQWTDMEVVLQRNKNASVQATSLERVRRP